MTIKEELIMKMEEAIAQSSRWEVIANSFSGLVRACEILDTDKVKETGQYIKEQAKYLNDKDKDKLRQYYEMCAELIRKYKRGGIPEGTQLEQAVQDVLQGKLISLDTQY